MKCFDGVESGGTAVIVEKSAILCLVTIAPSILHGRMKNDKIEVP